MEQDDWQKDLDRWQKDLDKMNRRNKWMIIGLKILAPLMCVVELLDIWDKDTYGGNVPLKIGASVFVVAVIGGVLYGLLTLKE